MKNLFSKIKKLKFRQKPARLVLAVAALLIIIGGVWGALRYSGGETARLDLGKSTIDLSKLNLPGEFKISDDEAVPLTWTDDNSNENLIIQSDRRYYSGSGQTDVYFSVTNASPEDQAINIYFWFDDAQKIVATINKIDSQTSASQPLAVSKWPGGKLPRPQGKDIKNYTNGSQTWDAIATGQTNFYKAAINYPASQNQSEFFIEAFGYGNNSPPASPDSPRLSSGEADASRGGQPPLNLRGGETASAGKGALTAYGLLDPYLSSGLVGYWSFDGANMGTTSATDLTGLGNTGWLNGGVKKIMGVSGQALQFDGTNDFMDSANFADNLAEMTVSFWFNTSQRDSGTSKRRVFIGKMSNSSTGAGWQVRQRLSSEASCPDGFDVLTQEDGGSHWKQQCVTTKYNDGKWHHFVWTLTGGPGSSATFTVYVDGVSKSLTDKSSADPTFSSMSTTKNVIIGKDSDGNSTTYYKGKLDDVRIYSRVLSAAEIGDLYRHDTAKAKVNTAIGSAGGLSSANGLVGYWSFDGANMGTTSATDLSGLGHTGWLLNGVKKVTGISGQALKFDGVDDYVNGGNVGNVQTISYWVKSNNQANGGIELNANQYIDDNAIPEGLVDPTLYVDGVQKNLYGTEKVSNGNMESNSSWADLNAPTSQAQSSEQAHGGTYSWKIVNSDAAYKGVQQVVYSVSAGQVYKVSGWIYVASGAGALISIRKGSDSAWIADLTPTITSTGFWQYTVRYVTVPVGETSLKVFILSNNQTSTFYADDVSMTLVNTRYPITDTNWHHVVITTGTAVNASAVKIGKGGTSYLNGTIDDVRMYNRVLSASEIANLYNAGAAKMKVNTPVGSGATGLSSGLAGYWSFDGANMGTTSARDLSVSNNTGWLNGGVKKVAGISGQALKFDGVNDYVAFANPPALAAPYTVSLWFYPRRFNITQGLMAFSLAASQGIKILNTSMIEAVSYTSRTASFRASCNKVFTDSDLNKWWNLQFIVNSDTDSSQWKCYLNGADAGITNSSSLGYVGPSSEWYLGTGVGSSNCFLGKIDDVRIYSRALSADEIFQLYQAGTRKVKIKQ